MDIFLRGAKDLDVGLWLGPGLEERDLFFEHVILIGEELKFGGELGLNFIEFLKYKNRFYFEFVLFGTFQEVEFAFEVVYHWLEELVFFIRLRQCLFEGLQLGLSQ